VGPTAPVHAAAERRHLGLREVESVLPPQAADIQAATSQVHSGDATSEAVAIARGVGEMRRQVGPTGQEERKGWRKPLMVNGFDFWGPGFV
jgi:hypothetical protein